MSTVMAAALRRGRDRYNSRFAYAMAGQKMLDPAVFEVILRETIAPLVEAAHSARPAAVDHVLESLFDVALALLGKGLLGPYGRIPGLGERWRMLLESCPAMLVADPGRFASAVANALCRFEGAGNHHGDAWTSTLMRLAPVFSSLDELFDAGRIVAWRLGILDQREPAFRAIERLPGQIFAKALELDKPSMVTASVLVARLRNDPWLAPADAADQDFDRREKRLCLVRIIGGFRGFGGVFVSPPMVDAVDGAFVATDRETVRELSADRFGHSWRRPVPESLKRSDPQPTGPWKWKAGELKWEGLVGSFPELAERSSAAAIGSTMAVTLPHSHNVYLLAPSISKS
ncbi:MAG: hypothetical protein HQM09_12650 [Candidatus Riflebacteria bacterium]|nr:hypothetical protein [Candidatus Riflebacteria bacterium]